MNAPERENRLPAKTPARGGEALCLPGRGLDATAEGAVPFRARRRRPRLPWGTLLAAFAPFLAGGCLGYRLGSTLPEDLRTVHVPACVNETSEPLLEIETTHALMNELRRDGALRVTGASEADAVLAVRLVQYRLEPLRYERGSRRTASEYRLALRARLEFTRAATGEVLVERTVKGESTFTASGDLASEKRAALPAAAKDLARNIVESVVEYW